MNKSLISKIYFPQCLFFSKIIHMIQLFTWNTNNTDRNGVTHTHTHTHTHIHTNTHQTLRKITLARASLYESKWYPLVKDSPIPLVFPTPPYFRQKLEPPFFSKILKTQFPLCKRGCATMSSWFHEHFQKQPLADVLQNKCSKKFCNILY